MIAGYLGNDNTFDNAIAEFARTYATLNDLDYAAHQDAVNAGNIRAERDI